MPTSTRRFAAPFVGALALMAAAPALAQDATDPPPPLDLTGSVALVSDYRFRGVSQTGEDVAVQAGLTLTHQSGFYVGTWASNIDNYVAAGADAEVDFFAGYKLPVGGSTLDIGLLYYFYTGDTGNANTDFFEPYVSLSGTYGPASYKVGAAYGIKSKALASPVGGGTKDDNLYLYTDVSAGLGSIPVTVRGHIGYSAGRSYLTFGLKDYLDWNIGVDYSFGPLTLGLSYIDTDIKKGNAVAPYFIDNDIVDATVMLSLTAAF